MRNWSGSAREELGKREELARRTAKRGWMILKELTTRRSARSLLAPRFPRGLPRRRAAANIPTRNPPPARKERIETKLTLGAFYPVPPAMRRQEVPFPHDGEAAREKKR
jgi:hypothetical protein